MSCARGGLRPTRGRSRARVDQRADVCPRIDRRSWVRAVLRRRPWTAVRKKRETNLGMVEAAGVEPASENASERTSTRVGTLFEVSRLPAAAGLQAQQADEVSTSICQRVRRSSLIVAVLRGYRRKLREPSLPKFRRREQQRYRSQLQVCPFLRGHGRHDAQSEHRHPRRIRYAPLSKNTCSVGLAGASVTASFSQTIRARSVDLAWTSRCSRRGRACRRVLRGAGDGARRRR